MRTAALDVLDTHHQQPEGQVDPQGLLCNCMVANRARDM